MKVYFACIVACGVLMQYTQPYPRRVVRALAIVCLGMCVVARMSRTYPRAARLVALLGALAFVTVFLGGYRRLCAPLPVSHSITLTVGLPAFESRRSSVREQAQRIGLKNTFLYGTIDAPEPDTDFGEFQLSSSMLNVMHSWHRAFTAATTHDWTLIMEDDAVFLFPDTVKCRLGCVAHADVVHLDTRVWEDMYFQDEVTAAQTVAVLVSARAAGFLASAFQTNSSLFLEFGARAQVEPHHAHLLGWLCEQRHVACVYLYEVMQLGDFNRHLGRPARAAQKA